jgi:hypothetical protein
MFQGGDFAQAWKQLVDDDWGILYLGFSGRGELNLSLQQLAKEDETKVA